MRWKVFSITRQLSHNPDRILYPSNYDSTTAVAEDDDWKCVHSITIRGVRYDKNCILVVANSVETGPTFLSLDSVRHSVSRPTDKDRIVFVGRKVNVCEYDAAACAYRISIRPSPASIAYSSVASRFPLTVQKVFDRRGEYFLHLAHKIVPTFFINQQNVKERYKYDFA